MKRTDWFKDKEKGSDFEHTRKCVEDTFSCSIFAKTRKRNNVEARMVFVRILREQKVKYERIGFYLKMGRTSMIYLSESAETLMSFNEKFREKYFVVKSLVNREDQIQYTEDETLDYKEQISSLKCIIDELNLERKYTTISNNKYKRLGTIINMIDINTPEGQEEMIEKQIENMFKRIEYRKNL